MPPVIFLLMPLALTSGILSLIFFMAWRTQGHKQHALTWSLSFVAISALWCSILLTASFPNWISYWVVSNGFLIAAVYLGLLGHCQRVQSESVILRSPYPPLLVFSALIWFVMEPNGAGLHAPIGPAYTAATLAASTFLILRHRRRPNPAEWGVAISMLVFALSQFIAVTVIFLQFMNVEIVNLAVYKQVNFLALPAAYTGMGMFVLFMLFSDLSVEMKKIADVDQLTGLLNRRGYAEAAAAAFAASRRTGQPVSVIMTDIDRFKNINDRHGHQFGDVALSHFAKVLSRSRHGNDIVARVGGEEFAVVLPGINVQESILIANRLCELLAKSPIETPVGPLTMTASFGVATISARDTCLSDVVHRADAALYRAKDRGRNRVDLEASQIMLLDNGQLTAIAAAR